MRIPHRRMLIRSGWILLIPLVILFAVAGSSAGVAQDDEDSEWIQIFNGENLDGWTPHIAKHGYGNNYGDTFRVKDGKIIVSYDQYESYQGRPGHLFYREPYSHYVLKAEYRFVGEQLKGGPGWARRNSGIMLHCQDPETMEKNQGYPASMEAQLLGGWNEGERTTANLCTPGTNAVMDGELVTQHCINSSSDTYHGDQWVSVTIEVRGNESVKHYVEGNLVFEYTNPQLEESEEELIEKNGGKQLHKGYISLQSESHPIEFRNVRLKKLEK